MDMTETRSLRGLRTPPNKEIRGHLTHATWEVPRKRKPRWTEGRHFKVYSMEKEEFYKIGGGEVTTSNSFTVLDNSEEHKKNEDSSYEEKTEI